MRILVVQESNWIDRGPHQSHHLMERMVQRGHEVRVIDFNILWRNDTNRKIISKRSVFSAAPKAILGAKISVIRPCIIQLPIIEYISLLISHHREIKRQLKEFKPDVVVGFGILNANMAILECHKLGIPFVYYIIDELHRLVPQKSFQNLAKKIESNNMKRSDIAISINEGLREYSIQMGAKRDNTAVIRAGIDPQMFRSEYRDPIRKDLGFDEKDIVLFFMGWLYDFSGLKEVAIALSKASNKNIKLLILGKGDLWNELLEIITKSSLQGRIIMKEWVPYHEVSKYIMAVDICILPAYKNDIMMNIVPIKLYEYLAAGKPVIATNLVGLKKEFGEGNGLTYINRSEETIEIAGTLIDQEKIKSEGIKGKNFVKNSDWDSIVTQFEKIISGLRI